MAEQTRAGDDDGGEAEVRVPRPAVIPLSSVPVTPADSWPERLDVANMITQGEHGSEVLLGAAWMQPGQECNPWSFEQEDPQIDGLTFYGPTHETYFVVRGTLELSWNGGSLEAGPDDAVYLAPGYRYALRCIGDEPAYFLWSMSPPPV